MELKGEEGERGLGSFTGHFHLLGGDLSRPCEDIIPQLR